VIIVASVLMIMGALMVSIQMGYDYLVEQRLQKAADLAALSAVQVLVDNHSSGDASTVAQSVAANNGASSDGSGINVVCGVWSAGTFAPGANCQNPNPGTTGAPNAVQVQVSGEAVSLLPNLFGGGSGVGNSMLTRQAVAAAGSPVAMFSVGSRLLSLNQNGLVASILKTVGLDPTELNVLDKDGLASAMITPSGILQAMGLPPTVMAGVGTPDQLAQVKELTLGQVLNIYAEALGKSSAVAADVAALGENIVGTTLNGPKIQLFGDGGIFANVTTANLASALNSQVSLGDLIGSSIVLANGENLGKVGLATNVVGLLNVKAGATVIAQPTLMVGGLGASATNTQVTLSADIASNDQTGLGKFLSGLVAVNLPIALNVGSSTATISDIDCQGRSATFNVDTKPAQLCIGGVDTCDAGDPAPQPGGTLSVTGIDVLPPISLAAVSVGGISSASSGSASSPVTLYVDPPRNEVDGITGSSEPPLTVQGQLTDFLNGLVVGTTDSSGSGKPCKPLDLGCILGGVVGGLQALVGTTLKVVGNLLTLNWQGSGASGLVSGVIGGVNPLLDSLAQTLGINIGETDIKLYSVTCGIPQLVQ